MQQENPLTKSPIYLINKSAFSILWQTRQFLKLLLLDEKICMRCVFRVYGFTSTTLYRDVAFYIELIGSYLGIEALKIYLVNSFCFAEVCWLCEGILQKKYAEKIGLDILNLVKARGIFNLNKYKLMIRVPTIFSIKYLILLTKSYNKITKLLPQKQQLYKQLFQPQLTNIIEVKTALKWLISFQLNSHSDLAISSTINEDQCTLIVQIQQIYKNTKKEQETMNLFENDLPFGRSNTNPLKKIKVQAFQLKCNQTSLNKLLKIPHEDIVAILAKKENLNQFLKSQIIDNIDDKVQLYSKNIYFCGKYIKYSRYLSQTPWIINGKRLTQSSLQDQIQNKIFQFFYPGQAKSSVQMKFHSGGREDIDVRMLHGGRPFVIEMVNPLLRLDDIDLTVFQSKLNKQSLIELKQQCNGLSKSQTVTRYLQKLVNFGNKLMKIRQLRQTTDSYISNQLKAAEMEKIKHYLCFIQTKQPLTPQDKIKIQSIKNLKLQQKTPIRVLHRRTLMVRQKQVHRMVMHPISQYCAVVELWGSAGTYIKQFVHGDLNRTRPNLGQILGGKSVDILQLDVGSLKQGLWKEQDVDKMKLPQLQWQME